MLAHYFKIATRNLLKYKQQTAISIVGLAIGFTCFALSMLWIRYEMGYDNFHEGAERIFVVRTEDKMSNDGLSLVTPSPLAAYLQETFPEIEYACNIIGYKNEIKYNGTIYPVFQFAADSVSMHIFPIQVIQGNFNFITNKGEIALTEEMAEKLFGKENPIGKTVRMSGKDISVCAVVKSWGKHSNLPFDIISANDQYPYWSASGWQTFIRLREKTDKHL
ncbi:MAG: ABC transporter permease [Parabacteroides sp.]|nr:ABC transporter permease [Parabacteroides sp.]